MTAPLHHYCLIKFTIQTLFTLTGIRFIRPTYDWVKSILGLLAMMTTLKGKQTAIPYTPLPLAPFFGREWVVRTVERNDFKAALKEGCLWKRRAASIRRERKTTQKLMQMILFLQSQMR
ncbi:hypothetical protein CDAR_467331 [Caerostris darwini]|uniref:Uncharacterized protein n=1 Tax=Caerostris darwini TaxID=1538125 RepID=A0AAV4U2I4_9ARAC|nr:hypothetical protein CDAR_467331 [Caerostris darwini]